jgi:hypothetical protein
MEVLILRELQVRFVQMLIMESLADCCISRRAWSQSCDKSRLCRPYFVDGAKLLMSMTFAPVAHLGHFLQVLILKSFKSCKTEVLILRELRAGFAQVLIMRSLA